MPCDDLWNLNFSRNGYQCHGFKGSRFNPKLNNYLYVAQVSQTSLNYSVALAQIYSDRDNSIAFVLRSIEYIRTVSLCKNLIIVNFLLKLLRVNGNTSPNHENNSAIGDGLTNVCFCVRTGRSSVNI